MAAAHGQAGDGAGSGLRDGAEVLLDEGDDLGAEAPDVAVHEEVALGFAHLRDGITVPAHLHRLLGDTEGAGGRLVGIAVGHDHDHRLGKALFDEVVEDLGGAAHGGPGLLVTAGAVQQVQDRILLLGIGLVAVRGIDGQAAVHAQEFAVIPGMTHSAVLGRFTIVLGTLAGDDEHREVAGAVALDIHVLRVIDSDAVHDEVIGVDFRLGEGNLHFPDIVLAALHVDGAAPGVGHPGSAQLDDGGVVGLQAEGHAVVLDFRGDDGLLTSAEVEVRQFLGVHRAGDGQGQGNGCEDVFHDVMN